MICKSGVLPAAKGLSLDQQIRNRLLACVLELQFWPDWRRPLKISFEEIPNHGFSGQNYLMGRVWVFFCTNSIFVNQIDVKEIGDLFPFLWSWSRSSWILVKYGNNIYYVLCLLPFIATLCAVDSCREIHLSEICQIIISTNLKNEKCRKILFYQYLIFFYICHNLA